MWSSRSGSEDSGSTKGCSFRLSSARDRWLKPGGVMIPRLVTAWAALVHDRYLEDMVDFLRDNPYGLRSRRTGRQDRQRDPLFRHLPSPRGGRQALRARPAVDDGRGPDPARAGTGASRSRDGAPRARPRYGQRARTLVQRRARARHLALRGTRRSTDALGDDDGPATLACGAHARHGGPRQSQDRPGPADRDLDKLGHRAARRRLGGARRAGDLGGDRRLNNLSSPRLRQAPSPSLRYWRRPRLRPRCASSADGPEGGRSRH